jgi:hypothetical protein
MKQSFSKKLVLNKTTVTDLNSKEMTDIKGGLTWTDPRACKTKTQCSIYYTIDYTCVAGCPPCGAVPIPTTID